MLTKHEKRIIWIIVLVLFFLFLFTFIYIVKPETIVNKLGVLNAYILTFIVSFFGGFSAGGSMSFISLLITFAIGGLNPIYLGLIAGTSLAIGDMIMFYIGFKGRELVNKKWDKKINRVSKIFEKKRWLKKFTPIFAYIYVGLTPFPNDLLILFLGAIKYSPKKMLGIIILGDLTFALTIATLASKGIILLF